MKKKKENDEKLNRCSTSVSNELTTACLTLVSLLVCICLSITFHNHHILLLLVLIQNKKLYNHSKARKSAKSISRCTINWQKHLLLMNYLSHWWLKHVKNSLVAASQMWESAAFLCFYNIVNWISLDCWSDILETLEIVTGICHQLQDMDIVYLLSWQPLTAIKSNRGRLDWPCFKVIAWSGIAVLLLLSSLCLSRPPTYPPTNTHMHMCTQHTHTPSESQSVYSGACSLGAAMNSCADFNTQLPLRQMPKQILS